MTEEHTCGVAPGEAEREELFSGFIDGVLTQGDEQRIRLRLASCPACGQLVEEMRSIRENARTTRFAAPDTQWDERPSGSVSSSLRRIGWLLLSVWLGLNLWLLLTWDPERTSPFPRLLVGLSLVGWLALLASVLVDRMRHRESDRYRRVRF